MELNGYPLCLYSQTNKIKVSFKTQLLANNKQATYFAKASGVARFAWNWALSHVRGQHVKVPNLGWVKMAEVVKYGGHINAMTISRSADKWYVSFSMDVDVSMLPSKNQACCCVDLGINKLATLSNGPTRYWDTPKPLQSALRQLARYQRRLTKKVKLSKG